MELAERPATRAAGSPRVDRGMVVGGILAGAGILVTLAALPIFVGGAGFGYDFRAYWEASGRLLHGAPLYLPELLAGPFTHGLQTYVYSPLPAVLLLPLAELGLLPAGVVWMLFKLAATVGACALLPVSRSVRLAVLGVTLLGLGSLVDLNLGSVNAVLLLGLALAWRFPDGPIAGLAAAINLSIRPYLATVVVGWALWRHWRPIVWTLGLGLVLVIASMVIVGSGAYIDFVRLLENIRFAGAPHNGAAAGVLATSGASGGVLGVIQILATLVTLVVSAVALVLSRRRDPDVTFAVAVGASLLASPVLWDHYLLLLAIPAALLAERGRPWGLALPLLAWLPWQLYPIVALLGTIGPLLARPALAVDPPVPRSLRAR